MSNFLEKVKTTAINTTSTVSYKMHKYAPEINLALGIVAFAGTIVSASKAALEVDGILERHNDRLSRIHEGMEVDEEYKNEGAARRDLIRAYSATVVDFAKHYALTAVLGGLSIAFIVESHKILNQRYLSATAAYTALSEVFKDYRGRVKTEFGDEMDRHFRYGTELNENVEKITDENGKKVTQKTITENIDTSKINTSTAVVFDETNENWDPNPKFNLQWLRAREQMCNDKFKSRGKDGIMVLNEVYEALGFPPTQEGAILGWVRGMGDNRIDFGLYNLDTPGVRRFINGQENFVLLDFNVDGIVWNKLPSRKELPL